MFSRNELDDYFMNPYFLEGVGNIYPVGIKDYYNFKELASRYIIQGNKTLHNLYKVDIETNLYDYFVNLSIQGEEELKQILVLKDYEPKNDEEKEQVEKVKLIIEKIKNNEATFYLISDMEILFTYVLKRKVKFDYNNSIFNVIDEDKVVGIINRDNFNLLREIIMWQNILFEIPTSPSKFGNQAIERAIKAKFGDSNSSLSSICSVVACNSGVSNEVLQEYTYYRLIYDFSIINRTHGNMFSFMLRSQGCAEATVNDLSDDVDLHENPYDSLFKKHKYSTKL